MRIDVDGTGLEVLDTGSGPAVLLIHGFPDTHRLWRHQTKALTDAGYRVIAPDLRGFGASDKPAEVGAYGAARHVGDMLGVLDRLGVERAHVVGHDWGALIAWSLAMAAPGRVAGLTALSVGHPASMADAGFEQRQKSWYMLLFQFRGIAEEWLSRDDFRNLRDWARHPEAEEVAGRLRDPGALTASLGIYRAAATPEILFGPPREFPPVTMPVMGVWSSGDLFLTEKAMRDSGKHVKGPWRYERVEDAGHWMQLEAPERVSQLLLDFLGEVRAEA
ncbi:MULTISPECIES: alpha/beta fold hydrolase [unclassified Streptomyces]|uniref:alpha/beta fold hydrolase n=1 Tax=unclassified Streptomyces TaxID=2593676 RepID=UPI000BF860AA|nr:alpha/beta fold hydrolase [Streptomyces sp. Ru87]PGH47391.1 alpha/beta hydrolase [Streptomyces sp. Ru87]